MARLRGRRLQLGLSEASKEPESASFSLQGDGWKLEELA